MPFSLSPSKTKTKTKAQEVKEGSPPKAPKRRLSGMFTDKVKRQLSRFDEAIHHVTHVKHEPNEATEVVRVRTQSLPSHHVLEASAVAVAPSTPTSGSSSHSSTTWIEKYHQEADTHSFDGASAISSTIEEHHLPTLLPPLSVDVLPELVEEQPQLPPESPVSQLPTLLPPVVEDNLPEIAEEQPIPESPVSQLPTLLPPVLPETAEEQPQPEQPIPEPPVSQLPTLLAPLSEDVQPEVAKEQPQPEQSLPEPPMSQLPTLLAPLSEDIQPEVAEEQPQPEQPLPEPPASTDDDESAEKSPPSEPMFTSPPPVFIEAETPDPFLIDEEGDAQSVGDEQQDSSAGVSQHTVSPAQNVPLDLPESDRQQPPPSPRPNVNKDVPPPPPSESEEEEEEEEEVPDVYVPALVAPTMFLPIPNTDPLTTLLNKYIYPPERRPMRDLTGDWQRSDFHTLVMTNSWRALARMARDRLVTSDPSDLTLVLGLWHLRLSCLARLRLFNQTSAETTNLFTVLNGIEPAETRAYVFERILPFELEVMQTRLKYWAGDHMGYLDALNALLKKCRTKCRQAGDDATLVPMWKERGARVVLIIASQMVEMKEITAAAKLLEPLCDQDGVSSPALRSSIGRIYLQGGNLQAAARHFGEVEADPTASLTLKLMNAALLASAEGDWTEASERFKGVLEQDADNYAAVNNLSVALLSQGKLKEAIEVLEKALHASPSSVVVAEPFLFNLSTLYELRSTTGFEKKKDLLIDVAKWGGDGLRTNCLKMPAN